MASVSIHVQGLEDTLKRIHIHGETREAARDIVHEFERRAPDILDVLERETRRRGRMKYEFC